MEDKVTEKLNLSLSIALGTSDKLTEKLDEIFYENEDLYRDHYQKNFSHSILYKFYSIKYTKQIKQAMVIVSVLDEQRDTAIIEVLIKRGYSSLYRFITQNKFFTCEDVIKNLNKNSDLKQYGELALFNAYAIIAYLMVKNRVFMALEDVETCMSFINQYLAKMESDIKLSLEGNSELHQNAYYFIDAGSVESKEYKYLINNYTIDKKFYINQFLDKVITNNQSQFLNVAKSELTNIKILRKKKITNEMLQNARKEVFGNGSSTALLGALTGILRTFSFYEGKYPVHILNKKETEILFKDVVLLYHQNDLYKRFDLTDILVIVSFMTMLLKENELSNNLYENAFSEKLNKKYKMQYENAIRTLKKDLEMSQTEDSLNRRKLSQTEERLNKANKEIDRLKKSLEEARNEQVEFTRMKTEVVALRNFTYTAAINLEFPNNIELQLEEMIKKLNDEKIVIIGGHSNWQNKIKVKLPNVKFIDIDKTGSFDALKTPGVKVIINTLSNCHSNYHKALATIYPGNKIYFLNSNINIEISIKQIYKEIILNS